MDTIETLRTFVRVVETGSLSAVAREISASQSTVSRQITQLNDQLLKAYIQKDNAQAQVDEANRQIQAIRNLMAGVPVGQQLAEEAAAEKLPTN